MRWVVSLGVLGLLMALFHRVAAGGPLEARATLALGFLLLAAHLGGDLARRVRLPRITGVLLIGVAVGPAWLGLVRGEEVRALAFVGSAAAALIAFGAGAAVTLDGLRSERRALARLSAGAIVLPVLVVALPLLALSAAGWFPLTAHQPPGDAVAVALVLGVAAAAASPAVTMALIDELDARGSFARSILGVTVVMEVAVVVLFAAVLAVARPLASAGALHAAAVWTTLRLLAGSIALGVLLAVVVARYLRLAGRDSALFLAALAFFLAEIARLLELDAMLMALAAGFWMRNFSRAEGERLATALQRGSLPVYVLFFALAGAGLELGALSVLWPWVLLIAGLRVLALRTGTRWAGRAPGVTPDLARHGWLGLISQAGVTVGLAAVARRAFPEWGVSLEALIVATIAVHELVGPICFRYALVRAGEVTEESHVAKPPLADGVAVVPGGGPRGL